MIKTRQDKIDWTDYDADVEGTTRYYQRRGVDVHHGQHSRAPNFDMMFASSDLRPRPQYEGQEPCFWYIGYYNVNLNGAYGGDQAFEGFTDERKAIAFLDQLYELLSNEYDPRNNYRVSMVLPYWPPE